MAPSPPFSVALAMPTGARGTERTNEEHIFLAVAVATAALNIFAPAVCHAQNYIVNGHKASKAEAPFLASYSAPAGHWQVDGYGISRVADEHQAPPVVKTPGRKCWYVLDVQLCD
jgi:hypothetical protein